MGEFWMGTGCLLVYFVVCASVALIARRLVWIPNEVFRKTLHLILLGSLLIWVLCFRTWWIAALSAVLFEIVVYPILKIAERWTGYSELVTERKKGELKSSLIIVFTMFAIVISICWGWQNDKMLVLASVYAWGFGDAAAALIGKRFGKHPIEGKHIEGRKSVEGTSAMFLVSLVCVSFILILRGGLTWQAVLLTAVVTAAVSAVVELFSLSGNDTITCPLAAMAVMLPLLHLLGGGV